MLFLGGDVSSCIARGRVPAHCFPRFPIPHASLLSMNLFMVLPAAKLTPELCLHLLKLFVPSLVLLLFSMFLLLVFLKESEAKVWCVSLRTHVKVFRFIFQVPFSVILYYYMLLDNIFVFSLRR